MRIRRMHRRFYDAGCHGIHPDAIPGIFDGERAGHGVQPALRQCGQARAGAGDRLADHGGGDLHDMTALPGQHVRNRQLRDVEKTIQVDMENISIVVRCERREGLADENTGIVHERIDPSEMPDGSFYDSFGDGALANIAGHRNHTGIAGFLDEAGICDDGVSGVPVTFDDSGSDALRGTCDDRNFLRLSHGQFPLIGWLGAVRQSRTQRRAPIPLRMNARRSRLMMAAWVVAM
ncbi:MAG TPA: hypothetical protein VG274_11455, partial [Rhizomicrobium sp.]|nr:hypothetical protein [Rhizomicrobium sp.]